MSVAAIVIISHNRKHPKYLSTHEWLKKKLWYISTVRYYSAIRKKKTIKSERSLRQRLYDFIYMTFYKRRKYRERTENMSVIASGWE